MYRDRSILVVVDVQERMMPVIDRADEVLENTLRLVRGLTALSVPMLVTEQYPKGLGTTVPALQEALGQWYRPIEKMSFSAAGEMRFMQQFETAAREQVLICGVEAHVCVYQTAQDLRNLGWQVEVVTDAVSSRRRSNKELAIQKLISMGVGVTSVEMALFELMQRADIPEFREVSRLVK